jgi:DNA-binding NtrC family response regulator
MPALLVVEDDAAILKLAQSALQSAGHETMPASSVAEAQAIIHSEQTVDLVFTDIALGADDEGGVTVGQSTGRLRSGTPVLYTSGRPITDDMRALFVNPHGFLPKPYRPSLLLTAISVLLGTGRRKGGSRQ